MSAYIHAVDHPIIDIGLNLTSFKYEHRIEQVLQNASSANVSHILITGTNVRKSLHAIVIAKKYQNVNNIQLNTTFGVHPHDAKHASNTEKLKKQIRDAIKQNNGIIKAVGECGLDFNRMFSPKDVQIQVFEAQMQIAAELNLPVFLHCRDAFDDFYRILCKYPSVRKCVHCHTEDNAQHLAMLLQLDCYIGITGWVCDDRRGKGLAALMKQIPLNRLMIETDGPFLLPRNMPRPYPEDNESGYLGWVVKGISAASRVSEKDIAIASTRNAIDFFGLL